MKMIGDNRSTRGETCPSATLCTTNPTWTDLESNPGLRGERPATNHLSPHTSYRLSQLARFIHEDKANYVKCNYVISTQVSPATGQLCGTPTSHAEGTFRFKSWPRIFTAFPSPYRQLPGYYINL
jgi:hypothetical protein